MQYASFLFHLLHPKGDLSDFIRVKRLFLTADGYVKELSPRLTLILVMKKRLLCSATFYNRKGNCDTVHKRQEGLSHFSY